MGRIALGIEYDGAAVYGWQRQREVPSVQEHLEKALSTVANEPIEVQCAGRTDAGVHATGQVVHFNCDAPRSERAWTLGVNANLPNSVAVTWAKNVADDFHARFSATHRRYRYVIHNAKMRPAILSSTKKKCTLLLKHYWVSRILRRFAPRYAKVKRRFATLPMQACTAKVAM